MSNTQTPGRTPMYEIWENVYIGAFLLTIFGLPLLSLIERL